MVCFRGKSSEWDRSSVTPLRQGLEGGKNWAVNNSGCRNEAASTGNWYARISSGHTRLAGKQTALHKPARAIRSSHYLLTFRMHRHTCTLVKLVCRELSFDAADRSATDNRPSKLLRHWNPFFDHRSNHSPRKKIQSARFPRCIATSV